MVLNNETIKSFKLKAVSTCIITNQFVRNLSCFFWCNLTLSRKRRITKKLQFLQKYPYLFYFLNINWKKTFCSAKLNDIVSFRIQNMAVEFGYFTWTGISDSYLIKYRKWPDFVYCVRTFIWDWAFLVIDRVVEVYLGPSGLLRFDFEFDVVHWQNISR